MTPLQRLREICRPLPGVVEVKTFGHPTFRAGKKTFAVLDDMERKGMLTLVVKLTRAEQRRTVDDTRVFPSKFGAKHGWTSFKIDSRTPWTVMRRHVLSSYRLMASSRMLALFE